MMLQELAEKMYPSTKNTFCPTHENNVLIFGMSPTRINYSLTSSFRPYAVFSFNCSLSNISSNTHTEQDCVVGKAHASGVSNNHICVLLDEGQDHSLARGACGHY